MTKVDLTWKRNEYDTTEMNVASNLYHTYKQNNDTLHLDNFYRLETRVEINLDFSKVIGINDKNRGWTGSGSNSTSVIFFKASISPRYRTSELFMTQLDLPFSLRVGNSNIFVKTFEEGKEISEKIFQEMFNQLSFKSKSLKLRLSNAIEKI